MKNGGIRRRGQNEHSIAGFRERDSVRECDIGNGKFLTLRDNGAYARVGRDIHIKRIGQIEIFRRGENSAFP